MKPSIVLQTRQVQAPVFSPRLQQAVRLLQMSAQEYAQASDAFASWFKDQVLTLSGVDPTVAPLGPPTTEVYRWSARELAATQARGTVT